MVENRWSDAGAREAVERLGEAWGEDLALRVYTSRLIGADPGLVLHGGGNTSVKVRLPDAVTGEPVEVLCVKGSGWDLATIEPPGLPAVELEPLRRLRGVPKLSDEEMVNQVRRRLLDVSAPTPSVEALLHAFLPHRFVDHTHADTVLVLTNQPNGEALIREALGDSVAILPWIMPGHPLAEAVADAYEAHPDCEGVVLLHHGIFTFGDTAKDSYDRMIALCDRAERFAAERLGGARPTFLTGPAAAPDPAAAAARAAAVLPALRGALAIPRAGAEPSRFVAALRQDPELLAFAGHAAARELAATTPPITPDHVIRTKGSYLTLSAAEASDPDAIRQAVQRFGASYQAYFDDCAPRMPGRVTRLDLRPRVAVVEGVGLIGFGGDTKAACIAADLAEQTIRAKALGAALGTYRALEPFELFEMEYWSLEQAKLGRSVSAPLAGRIALLTGAGGAIGHGIARELLAAGCHVFLTDVDHERLERVAGILAGDFGTARLSGLPMDVTDSASVAAGFAACVRAFGGLDVLVPNAGVAHVSELAAMDDAAWSRVVAVNLDGTMRVIREAARIFAVQQSGGHVVVQASKNVFAPGASFGAYSASKAGALQLARIAALELAPLGVHVNAINADAVFGDGRVDSGLWSEVGPERMRARGLDAEGLRAYYRDRSLLKVEVTAEAVGRAVVFFASGQTPTTGAVLPVDGGVPGAFPR